MLRFQVYASHVGPGDLDSGPGPHDFPAGTLPQLPPFCFEEELKENDMFFSDMELGVRMVCPFLWTKDGIFVI